MSKEDIEIIWQNINCEACYGKNINYCKKECECKCREFKALENILSYLENLGEINFNLLQNGVPKELFRELQLELKKEKNENEANKKKMEELEEKQKSYNIAYNQGKAFEKHKWKSAIKKLIETKRIEYDCEDCVTGNFIEVEDIEKLLKDGGEAKWD